MGRIITELGKWPEPPKAVAGMTNKGFPSPNANFSTYGGTYLYDYNADNGNYFLLADLSGTTTDQIRYYNSASTLQWEVEFTDIDATATHWLSVPYFDTVDNALYVTAYKTGTTYFAKIAISTGTVTNLYTHTHTDNPQNAHISTAVIAQLKRVTEGSGNIKLYYSKSPSNQHLVRITISEAGALVEGETEVAPIGYQSYVTENETAFRANWNNADTPLLGIARANTYSFQYMSHDALAFKQIGTDNCSFMHIGDTYVTAIGSRGTSGVGKQLFYRTEFDAWIEKLADIAGV